MKDSAKELESLKDIPVRGRSFKEYCNLFGFDSVNGKDLRGKKILDVGIGHSTFARYVNSHFENSEVIGLDIRKVKNLTPLEVADVTEPREVNYPQAESVIADARQFPFGDESFDEVISSNLSMYLGEGILRMIKEMARVCKKGGKIRITPTFFLDHAILEEFSREHILKILKPSDFKVEELTAAENGHKYKTTILTKL